MLNEFEVIVFLGFEINNSIGIYELCFLVEVING